MSPSTPGAVCEPWPLVASCLPECWSPEPAEWTTEQRTAVEVAHGLLTKLTAGVYGLCRVTVRPCRWRHCARFLPMSAVPTFAGLPYPVLHEGRIFNVYCACRHECGCGPICEVTLDGPVHDVVAVRIDGQIVDPTSYWVNEHRKLVRRDGTGCWPDCQALDKPDTEKGTWSVTYRRGVLPDRDGKLALTMAAVEVNKACRGKSCVLSERVTRVVREGIEIQLDTIEEIRRGSTGIPFIDRWVGLVNPYRAALPMRVYSPDTVRARRTTWPGVS